MEKKDKQYGIIVSITAIVILFIMLFILKYDVLDPPPREIPVEATMDLEQIEIEDFKIESGNAGGGSGSPSDDRVVSKPQEQVEKMLASKTSKSNVKVNSGESDKTTGKNTHNQSTTTDKSDDPFASGGVGGGDRGGKGKGLGGDTGDDNGNGTGGDGDGNGRPYFGKLNCDNILLEEDQKVVLRLSVNSEGEIINWKNTGKSTTTDQKIINQVAANIMKQIHFSKKAGASVESVVFPVTLHAR